ncbi:hypothetical protein D5S17_32205 [Pseudonocardiaceae bacterium YIM PH 21723]|nr:hypothetical protein D5S17_32205 [Pseudonocardiaceae bacterium YIM PH 21723]
MAGVCAGALFWIAGQVVAFPSSSAIAVSATDQARQEATPGQKDREPIMPASDKVELKKTLPDTTGAISINFVKYPDGRDIMFVSTTSGLKSFDVSDTDNPKALGTLTKAQLALPGDDPNKGRFWENEDMDVDPDRQLVFLARERTSFGNPRAKDSPTGVYIIDAKDPAKLSIASWAPQGTGHITTCINGCDYLWTSGWDGEINDPSNVYHSSGKIFVTDIRDYKKPKVETIYVDENRDQGVSHMTHDVQVDDSGVAWVAGTGGTRGYWTDGIHRDPVTGEVRQATPVKPVPYAGGAAEQAAMPTSFSHNSVRPVNGTLADGPIPSAENPPGSLLLHTEEAFGSPTCKDQGRFVISSLQGSFNGESQKATQEKPFYLKTVGIWSPDDKDGTINSPNTFCSAHYFTMQDRVVAYSWYEQGTRFLDISDPANPKQIAYWRPQSAVSWASYWHRDRVFVADYALGVQVLNLNASAGSEQVTLHAAPPGTPGMSDPGQAPPARLPFAPDPNYGMACPHLFGRDCKPGDVSCC